MPINDSGGPNYMVKGILAILAAAGMAVGGFLLTKTNDLQLTAQPLPALSVAGKADVVLDIADNTIKSSVNGGAYGAIGATGANPTATVSGSATNGSAATFMRSDAAPALAATAVTPGSYTGANITVDAQGRITSAADGGTAGAAGGDLGGTYPNPTVVSVADITTGTLPSARGGTGVNNAGTITNASNTTINGGGTLVLGGFTLTAPATGTAALGQVVFSGPTASRIITVPDAAFTAARTDAANTFTGHQTIEGVTATGATGTGNMVFSAAPTFTSVLTADFVTCANTYKFAASNINLGTVAIFDSTPSTGAWGNISGATHGWYCNDPGNKRRAATQTVTDSVTLTADDTMVCTILGGRKYSFRIVYYFTTVASSGVQVDCGGGTCTFTSFEGDVDITNLSSAAAILGGGEMTSATTAQGITVTGTVTKVVIEGAFVCNVKGTFAPRFAQNAETVAAESVVAKTNSFMWVRDTP